MLEYKKKSSVNILLNSVNILVLSTKTISLYCFNTFFLIHETVSRHGKFYI